MIMENDNIDIWVYDVARNTLSRLTFDEAVDYFPLWTPDGERIIFGSDREEGGLWWRAANGTGQVQAILTGDQSLIPNTFTPDGSQLVYESEGDLYLVTLDGESVPQRLTQTEFREQDAAISHDGRWIAYESNETGLDEIYVRPFPDVESGKWQISNGGGQWPKWAPNDTELFFRLNSATQNSVLSTRIDTANTFQHDIPSVLFSGNYRGTGTEGSFDLSPDGSQFLLIRGVGDFVPTEQTRLVAVQNWFEELKRLAPPDPQ